MPPPNAACQAISASIETNRYAAPWPLDSACSEKHPTANSRSRRCAAFEIRMQERQRERDPLHGGHVQLTEPEEPRRREREDQAADEGAGDADVQPARQQDTRRCRRARM